MEDRTVSNYVVVFCRGCGSSFNVRKLEWDEYNEATDTRHDSRRIQEFLPEPCCGEMHLWYRPSGPETSSLVRDYESDVKIDLPDDVEPVTEKKVDRFAILDSL